MIFKPYEGTALADAINDWLRVIGQYADDLSLTRINFLRPGGRVLEHVDPPDQNMIQCLLSGETVFDFQTKQGRCLFKMEVGDIWWFNTTWPHRTHNATQEKRLLLHTRGNLKDEFLRGAPETEPTETIPR